MADVKISELTEHTAVLSTEVVPIVDDGGATRKAQVKNIHKKKIRTVTAEDTLTYADEVIIVTADPTTIHFPDPDANEVGAEITIANRTITGFAIDHTTNTIYFDDDTYGKTTYTITNGYQVTFIMDGTHWVCINHCPSPNWD